MIQNNNILYKEHAEVWFCCSKVSCQAGGLYYILKKWKITEFSTGYHLKVSEYLLICEQELWYVVMIQSSLFDKKYPRWQKRQKHHYMSRELLLLLLYKARHTHKCLYMVLPKYSKIQVLPGITSYRLMKYNKQGIELNSLLINNMPKDGYEWINELWQLVWIWSEFGIKKPIIFTNPLLVQHKTHLQTKSTLNHTDNRQAGHTNENKQFWPKYKIVTITGI